MKEKEIEQLFDPEAGTFLADRFVKGTCPNCKSPDQYGDNCEKCGATYSPAELIDPRSTLSGATPVIKPANHLYIELEKLHGFLDDLTANGSHLQSEVANYLLGQFLRKKSADSDAIEPLRDWDVSRPAPYFGFEIPDSPGNYWYVWFDAPIGYMASTQQWCVRHGEELDDWWKNPNCEIHHFIGKDITYFHTLFWPGMLKTAGYSLPKRVHIHGFLTVDGEKMSKSRGTFIRARTYLEFLDPSYLRYYYATKLGAGVDDIDMNLNDLATKANTDLVGKVVNLASRTARMVKETGLSAAYPDDGGLFAQAAGEADAIAEAYESGEYHKAMRLVLACADRANQFVDQHAPWTLKKDPAKARQVQDVCTVTLNLFRQIVVYLAPVLPKLAVQTGDLLGKPIERWDEVRTPLTGTALSEFQHLLQRCDPKRVQAMVDASKEGQPEAAPQAVAAKSSKPKDKPAVNEPANTTSSASNSSMAPAESAFNDGPEALAQEPLADTVTFDEFVKVDIRVARVLTAEEVAESPKLMKLTVTLGGDAKRTIFAGIKGIYKPEAIVGRLILIAANLAPRKMKVGTSEGMVLAAGPGKECYLLSPDSGAVPGQRIH